MGGPCTLICCLLLTVGAVAAQTAAAQSERLLPQWLTGIIAVAAFLFLSFVAFLVKKAWCEVPRRTKTTVEAENESVVASRNSYETSLDLVRSKEDTNAYDNLVIENTDEKVTTM